MYRPRAAASRLLRLMTQFPAVVLVGARQVGKSTLLRHLLGDRAEILVFDPVQDIAGARSEPDLFLEQHRPPLVLDEIQYAPELVPALKRWIDRDRRPGMYVLTGSQQWEVLRSLAESLAGRVAFLDLEGFSLSELAGAIDEAEPSPSWLQRWLDDPEDFLASSPRRLPADRPLHERLWRGFLPEADALAEDVVAEFHDAYLRTYIERDARLLANVSDWALFGRFYRTVAAMTAQEINHSHLGRELGVTPATSRRWLDMLQATFQWHEVPAYSGNTLKRIRKRPKGYLADTGSVCAALRITSPRALADHPARGAIYETAVLAEIRRLASVLPGKPALHHWRTTGGAEVDLVLERDGRLYPIEAKATANPRPSDARGIRQFRETYPTTPIAHGLILAPTAHVRRLDRDTTALPWDLSPE